ncbi:hypothetical protein D3C80_965970 [compost metagenome]
MRTLDRRRSQNASLPGEIGETVHLCATCARHSKVSERTERRVGELFRLDQHDRERCVRVSQPGDAVYEACGRAFMDQSQAGEGFVEFAATVHLADNQGQVGQAAVKA